MSDPRKPIDNGRSWKAEFLPGSPGEKAIESLGLRPDHLRHDLVAFDEQIESLTAEITRLRADINSASNALRILYANLKTATTAMERCGLTAMVDGIRADIVTEPCISALSKVVPKEEI